MAGGRPFRNGVRAVLTQRAVISFCVTLVFLVLLLSSSPSKPSLSLRQRLDPAVSESPLDAHRDLIHRQLADHAALLSAYSAFAIRLKLASSRQVSLFSAVSSSLSSDVDDEKDARERIKFARQLAAESKESFDVHLKIQKLKDTIFSVQEQLRRAKKLSALSSQIAARSTPKSLHCLAMRLLEDRIAHPMSYPATAPRSPDFTNPDLFHYAIFSDNILAVSVVLNSALRNAAEPRRHIFHIVTDPMYLPAFQVWFAKRPPPHGALVELRSFDEFEFLNGTVLPSLDYLRFYLPELFPRLRRVLLLEDDVVVQKDISPIWRVNLDGLVNGAVETCFGGFKRYSKYLNFSHPAVKEQFSPRTCAWSFGVNIFDLNAWRREQCTDRFHEYWDMNKDGSLWSAESVLPAGLMTFYTNTKPLDKSWHVMGLGYNPSVSPEEIRNAAVIHFNGNMKPWLDVALSQYKPLWTKYVDGDMEFLQLCNFGL